MSIQPEHFWNTGAALPPRIIGTECEYKLQLPPGVGPERFIGDQALTALGIAHHGQYLGAAYGGSKLYVDIGQHAELARAEALGPARAAVEDIDGIDQLAGIITGSGLEHRGLYRTAGTYIPGELSDDPEGKSTGYTNGYHENYLMVRELVDDPLLDALVPTSLASRLWGMGGTLRAEGFVYSQKVWGTGGVPIERSVRRRTEHGKKPMAMIPPALSDADTVGDEAWARLEVRMADPGLSLAGRYLNFAATSLTLRLLELQQAGRLPQPLDSVSLLGGCLTDPVAAAKLYAADLTLRRTAPTQGGQQLTALDVQERLLDAFEALPGYCLLPADERLAIAGMRRVVDAFRRSRPQLAEYDAEMYRLTDCAPRHRTLSLQQDPTQLTARNPLQMSRDLRWGKVLPAHAGDPEGLGRKYWRGQAARGRDAYDRQVRTLAAASDLSQRAHRRAQIVDGPADGAKVYNWARWSDSQGNRYTFGGPYGDADEQALPRAA